jgi:uncharacterized membrane protein SirB2
VIDFYTAGSGLRILHVACATISVALFLLRGTWMLAGSRRFEARWTRIAPHVVDTVFLASGIALAVRIAQYPFVHDWLTAKVLGLVAYIILGSLAFRPGRPRPLRAAAFAAALAVFAWIVGVALTRNPMSWGVTL